MKVWKNRVERNVIGHAATSPLGKRAIRTKAPKEITELITAMKVLVEKESGSPKKANEIEEIIFKLGVKIFYLIQKGELSIGEVLVVDEPVRKGLDLFIRCRNHVIDRSEAKDRRHTVSPSLFVSPSLSCARQLISPFSSPSTQNN